LEVTLSDQKLPVLMNDRTTDFEKFHYFSFEQRVGVSTGMILSGKTMRTIMERSFCKVPRLNNGRYCTQRL
jgi:hypothetical protein